MGTPKRKSGHDGGGFDRKRKAAGKALRVEGVLDRKGVEVACKLFHAPALKGGGFCCHGSGPPCD